jgi:pimeloyl-ACP methyl ester carboxylesterase
MTETSRPAPARAAAELPAAVAAALARPAPGHERIVDAAGYAWRAVEWGDPTDPPLILVHGVTSNAETFWRIAPAVAAAGRQVVALDMPGHGRTGSWRGRHRFAETATDVAAFVRAARLDRPGLAVLGHSWGAMVAAGLPAAGLRPDRLVLLDPPVQPVEAMAQMTLDPLERLYPSFDVAATAVRAANPGWAEGDIDAKALGLTDFLPEAVLAVLLENGDWDGGLAALADPAAAGIPTWVIRGAPDAGCLVPDAALPAFRARVGRDHVITIAGAPHSPQRTHPKATALAILRALA